MKKWLLLASLLTLSSPSLAQKIKVKKVKGNQAIVEFAGGSLRPGQAYELTQDEFSNGSLGSGDRTYVISAALSLLNTKSDAAGASNETDFSIFAKFGWNLGEFELGPAFSYRSEPVGSGSASTYKFGAFADYNMIPNISGEPFLYGIGATGSFGQRDSGNSAKVDLMSLFAGPFAKWFPGGGNVGFRVDGGFVYQNRSANSSSETVSGLGVEAGIMAYF